MIAAGTTLQGRYIIERLIGQGGMGAVYLARQLSLNERPVAIKHMSMPRGQASDQARAAAQFQQEAATLATLRHPNLVSVHDFFSEGSEYFLVMEYVEGATLDVVLERTPGLLEAGRVTAWGQELCRVLRYLHEQAPPVVFRDLKPSNIMLDALGHLRLIDFGIAKSFQLQSATSTFIIGAGTPGFAAPEQYGTSDVDARTDIYALGAVLYTLLTKKAPCDAIDRVLGRTALVAASTMNGQVMPGLEAVIERMMALSPEQRYPTADEAGEALRAVDVAAGRVPVRTSGGGRPTEPVEDPAESSGTVSWTAVALVLLLLVGLSAVVIWQDEARSRAELEQRMQERPPSLTLTSGAPPEASPSTASPLPTPSVALLASATPSATPSSMPSAAALPASPQPSAAPSVAPEPTVAASMAPSPLPSASSAPHASPSPSPSSLLPAAATPDARGTSSANIVTTGSGLMYQDIKVGDGPVPRPGETVEVQYTAWLNNGTKLDSSADLARPFKFVLGRGQVIKGWDEGLSTMHAGGKRTLFIPANLAYGSAGAPPSIPPGATLILDVEIVGIQP